MGVNRKSSNRPGNNGLGDGPPDQGQNVRTEIEQLKRVAIEEITTRPKKSLEINADILLEIIHIIEKRIDGGGDAEAYLEIVNSVKERLNTGVKKYGGEICIDDPRDWVVEALNEIFDSLSYLAADLIKIRRARQWENLIGKDY